MPSDEENSELVRLILHTQAFGPEPKASAERLSKLVSATEVQPPDRNKLFSALRRILCVTNRTFSPSLGRSELQHKADVDFLTKLLGMIHAHDKNAVLCVFEPKTRDENGGSKHYVHAHDVRQTVLAGCIAPSLQRLGSGPCDEADEKTARKEVAETLRDFGVNLPSHILERINEKLVSNTNGPLHHANDILAGLDGFKSAEHQKKIRRWLRARESTELLNLFVEAVGLHRDDEHPALTAALEAVGFDRKLSGTKARQVLNERPEQLVIVLTSGPDSRMPDSLVDNLPVEIDARVLDAQTSIETCAKQAHKALDDGEPVVVLVRPALEPADLRLLANKGIVTKQTGLIVTVQDGPQPTANAPLVRESLAHGIEWSCLPASVLAEGLRQLLTQARTSPFRLEHLRARWAHFDKWVHEPHLDCYFYPGRPDAIPLQPSGKFAPAEESPPPGFVAAVRWGAADGIESRDVRRFMAALARTQDVTNYNKSPPSWPGLLAE